MFPVGALVVLKETDYPRSALPGATAIVTGLNRDYLYVRWERSNPLCNRQMDGAYFKEHFSLVKCTEEGLL